jgi:hypothetical protein
MLQLSASMLLKYSMSRSDCFSTSVVAAAPYLASQKVHGVVNRPEGMCERATEGFSFVGAAAIGAHWHHCVSRLLLLAPAALAAAVGLLLCALLLPFAPADAAAADAGVWALFLPGSAVSLLPLVTVPFRLSPLSPASLPEQEFSYCRELLMTAPRHVYMFTK